MINWFKKVFNIDNPHLFFTASCDKIVQLEDGLFAKGLIDLIESKDPKKCAVVYLGRLRN